MVEKTLDTHWEAQMNQCGHCQKENDPRSPRCWYCHMELPSSSPFFDSEALARSVKEPIASELEAITQKRYVELINLAHTFILENEQDPWGVTEGELETFFEILKTLRRLKK